MFYSEHTEHLAGECEAKAHCLHCGKEVHIVTAQNDATDRTSRTSTHTEVFSQFFTELIYNTYLNKIFGCYSELFLLCNDINFFMYYSVSDTNQCSHFPRQNGDQNIYQEKLKNYFNYSIIINIKAISKLLINVPYMIICNKANSTQYLKRVTIIFALRIPM